jgi:predicted regulator of Ras-like GTPase activity (Roadblock/LC7/MglB family)
VSDGTREQLLDLLEELGAIQGVRGALIATADGAMAAGARSGLPAVVANDVAKTVRRMTVASETVGVPLRELLINFGPARMIVIPLTEDATVVALLERDTAVSPVRSLIAVQVDALRELLTAHGDEAFEAPMSQETEDEISRIMSGDLAKVLARIRDQFSEQYERTGHDAVRAESVVREQLREWLLCCNPSAYTLPLLADGLGQLLDDHPVERGAFMEAAHDTIRVAQGEGAA